MINPTAAAIGAELRQRRKLRKQSRKAMAALCGIKKSDIEKLETGKLDCSFFEFIRIAECYGFEINLRAKLQYNEITEYFERLDSENDKKCSAERKTAIKKHKAGRAQV